LILYRILLFLNLAYPRFDDHSFEDGKTLASVLYGRFKEGMEPDVREAIEIDTTATLSESMGYRMYNEALRYTSANTRQLELYNVMKDFNAAITTILNRKCPENED